MRAHVSNGTIDGIPTHVVDYPALANDPDVDVFINSVRRAGRLRLC